MIFIPLESSANSMNESLVPRRCSSWPSSAVRNIGSAARHVIVSEYAFFLYEHVRFSTSKHVAPSSVATDAMKIHGSIQPSSCW